MRLFDLRYSRIPDSGERTPATKMFGKDQNLALGILGGLITALICASLWAAISFYSGRQIIIMSGFLGYLVGSAIRISGRGAAPAYGLAGALLAVAGCIIGNLLGAVGMIVEKQPANFFEALLWLNVFNALDILIELYQPIDILFYLIAGYCGFRFSIHPLKLQSVKN